MKLHNKEQTEWQKKSKRKNRHRLLFSLFACFILVILGAWFTALALIFTLFLLHELLWSDHIFYNPHSDYQYNFEHAEQQTLILSLSKILEIPCAIITDKHSNKTLLLEVQIESRLSGFFLDPYVLINGQAQYFERGLNGKRYLNLSHVWQNKPSDIRLEFRHCLNQSISGNLYSFSNPELKNKKILLIAPHADDAEIAAFGLYSQYPKQSFITTISAGEIEAEHYFPLTNKDSHKAGQIKGLLRSWDGIAIPQWGGLKAEQSIQLGYFCLRLKQMADNPDKNIASLASNMDDTRFFRQFNQVPLPSDQSGSSTWNTLCQDLSEIIKQQKPDIIVMPHPCYDPHRDHYFSSKAVVQALANTEQQVKHFFLYANHSQHGDRFPFGAAHSLQALPPQFSYNHYTQDIFSLPLEETQQRHKLLALAMMHDLNVPLSLKKRFRKKLQEIFLKRDNSPYGEDDYLRKAVQQNELFFVSDLQQVQLMLEENYFGY